MVGAGPAGSAAAAACADAGLRVGLVAPDPEARWPATYGVWADELDPLGLRGTVRARWAGVVVHGARPHDLPVPYALLDNAATAAALRKRVVASGGEIVAARVEGVVHDGGGSRLWLGGGRAPLEAGLVVDASGAAPALGSAPGPVAAVQAAAGVVAHVDAPPAEPGTCVLMDWRGGPGPDPSFLYAMDLGDGTWLLEETSLARRPPLPAAVLRERLAARLAAAGTTVTAVVAEEVVAIPMGAPPPPPGGRVVAFGAAAGLVHPATGYSVGASFRLAPDLARAVAAAHDRRAGADAVAAAAAAAVWPAHRRRARQLESYGLAALLRLDAEHVRAFFDAFFDLPVERWRPYLAGATGPAGVARVMAGVFARAPWGVRARLAAGDPRPFVRALRR